MLNPTGTEVDSGKGEIVKEELGMPRLCQQTILNSKTPGLLGSTILSDETPLCLPVPPLSSLICKFA